ncbi:MAG: Dna2/Cas4 domain-containing protein [Okeania sp. SIO2F4]|uniref:CRISPR-associated protein Cas4 n=1 Tax=Okeania sp. SIO2F4 TaxID=2607790 RepID=UPI00142BC6DD|nr:PD-(D/E)XK nuclease family protein [Okeania sp. SIO2F4]NES05274.1 Dna2/Cas4 domain-containing protein [Okeania sp. SIO2F4]
MKTSLKKRSQFYAWVTWLAQILANEKQCKYAVSLQTKYKFDKPSSNYDSSKHDEKVLERAAELHNEGFTVYIEDDNSFKAYSKKFPICVSGKPDIIATKDNWVIVEDIKTGRRKNSHKMQVLLYMFLLPLASETQELCHQQIPHGRIVYSDNIVEIPTWEVNQEFKQRLRELLAIICSAKIPKPTPSIWECRYCKVPDNHCPAKTKNNDNLAA